MEAAFKLTVLSTVQLAYVSRHEDGDYFYLQS